MKDFNRFHYRGNFIGRWKRKWETKVEVINPGKEQQKSMADMFKVDLCDPIKDQLDKKIDICDPNIEITPCNPLIEPKWCLPTFMENCILTSCVPHCELASSAL